MEVYEALLPAIAVIEVVPRLSIIRILYYFLYIEMYGGNGHNAPHSGNTHGPNIIRMAA